LFVAFDVEIVFLFPWAVKFKALGLFGSVDFLNFPRDPGSQLHLGLEKRALDWA
jgi:NADH-quinone oxidoreductase subunit A